MPNRPHLPRCPLCKQLKALLYKVRRERGAMLVCAHCADRERARGLPVERV